MKYTSAEANKLLKKLMEEKDAIKTEEAKVSSFVAATVENVDEVRPEYSYFQTQDKIFEIDKKIRNVKHEINVFNTTHFVKVHLPNEQEYSKMTIDECLVYIPQLTAMKEKLSRMSRVLQKERKESRYGDKKGFIEYEYANYDIRDVKCDLELVSEILAETQVALDKLNMTEVMEIDI